jgi:hypothetical protein
MSEKGPQLGIKFALLNLIEETDKFARAIEKLQTWHGPEFAKKSGFAKLYDDSCESINEGLRQIGGLDATVDATDTTPELLIKLVEWRGKHPDEPDRYKWLGVYAARMQVEVTLGPEAIQEMREKLLIEAITEV